MTDQYLLFYVWAKKNYVGQNNEDSGLKVGFKGALQ